MGNIYKKPGRAKVSERTAKAQKRRNKRFRNYGHELERYEKTGQYSGKSTRMKAVISKEY